MRYRVALISVGVVALFGCFAAWYARPILSVRHIGLPWQLTLHQSHCVIARHEADCTTPWPVTIVPPAYSATIQFKPLTRELLRADRTWNLRDSVEWMRVVDSTRLALGGQGLERLPCDTAVTRFAIADAWRLGAHEIRFYASPRMPVRGVGERHFATVQLVAFGAYGCEPRYGVRLLTPDEMAQAARDWLAKQIGY
jgi:hypothetical protein